MKKQREHRGGAFTLIDMMVSISVIALLIGIILPSMAYVRQMSRQVVCASNVRQIGFGLLMYADDHKDLLAPTLHSQTRQSQDHVSSEELGDTMTLRYPESVGGLWGDRWDGIGRLYLGEYLMAPKVFYCPAHRGDHPYRNYADEWSGGTGEIVGNYQYRGEGPNRQTRLTRIVPPRVALLTDGLRTIDDFNHNPGLNVLFADLSVEHLVDEDGDVTSLLPVARKGGGGGGSGAGDGSYLRDAWDGIDQLVK